MRGESRLGFLQVCALRRPVRPLSEISRENSTNREILVEIRPVEPERREFDVVELRFGPGRESRVRRDRERHFHSTLHLNVDAACDVFRSRWLVNQGVHSKP